MFDRITSDPAILGGKPIIRGTRISVEIVLEWFASGAGASPGPPEIRFDAIGVTYDAGGRLVALEHLEGAF